VTDWRDIGVHLFAEVREQWLHYAAAILNRADSDLNVPGLKRSRRPAKAVEASPGFIKAVYAWETGNPDDLIGYLRSDRPINKRDRQRLVGGIRHLSRRPNHRPENPVPKSAAYLAISLYEEWRARNRKANVSDRGYSRHMKDSCAEFIAQIFDRVDPEHIRALMDEKKERRLQDGPVGFSPSRLISRLVAERDAHQKKSGKSR
jgi:hypothetical protein